MLKLCATRHDFVPLDHYLAQFKLDNLPPLHVTYANGSSPVTMQGALTEVRTGDVLLKLPPNITWRAEQGCSYSVGFIDFGPDMGGASTQTSFFPFVHSLWTQCTRALADCTTTVKPYLPPGNPFVRPNRYAFLLFRHRRGAAPLMLHGGPAARLADRKLAKHLRTACTGFSIPGLLKENEGLEPVALNFALVHGHRQAAAGGTRRTARTRARTKRRVQ